MFLVHAAKDPGRGRLGGLYHVRSVCRHHLQISYGRDLVSMWLVRLQMHLCVVGVINCIPSPHTDRHPGHSMQSEMHTQSDPPACPA